MWVFFAVERRFSGLAGEGPSRFEMYSMCGAKVRAERYTFFLVVQQFMARGQTQQSSYPKAGVPPWRATPCNALFYYSITVQYCSMGWPHTTGVTPHARARTYVRINVRTSETAFTPLEAQHNVLEGLVSFRASMMMILYFSVSNVVIRSSVHSNGFRRA